MRVVIAAISTLCVLIGGCGFINSIELPDSVPTNSIFPAVVQVLIDESSQVGSHGGCSIMVPEEWTVDGVYYNGASSGIMVEDLGLAENLTSEYPPPSEYKWLSFKSTETCIADSGDVYYVHMTVHNDCLEGMIDLAFHVAHFDMYWGWYDPPVVDSLLVDPVTLDQATWAVIKTSFVE